jgi:hypothetical protein
MAWGRGGGKVFCPWPDQGFPHSTMKCNTGLGMEIHVGITKRPSRQFVALRTQNPQKSPLRRFFTWQTAKEGIWKGKEEKEEEFQTRLNNAIVYLLHKIKTLYPTIPMYIILMVFLVNLYP